MGNPGKCKQIQTNRRRERNYWKQNILKAADLNRPRSLTTAFKIYIALKNV